jgi:hypothetical protein
MSAPREKETMNTLPLIVLVLAMALSLLVGMGITDLQQHEDLMRKITEVCQR